MKPHIIQSMFHFQGHDPGVRRTVLSQGHLFLSRPKSSLPMYKSDTINTCYILFSLLLIIRGSFQHEEESRLQRLTLQQSLKENMAVAPPFHLFSFFSDPSHLPFMMRLTSYLELEDL